MGPEPRHDFSLTAEEQARRAFDNLDHVLAELGSDKTRIISATVILDDIENKPITDEIWADWIGDEPDHWPERSCHGVELVEGAPRLLLRGKRKVVAHTQCPDEIAIGRAPTSGGHISWSALYLSHLNTSRCARQIQHPV